VRPQAVDQAGDWNRLASSHRKHLDEGARLPAAERMLVNALDIQGAKYADLQFADCLPA
jgi:hypothetical protein